MCSWSRKGAPPKIDLGETEILLGPVRAVVLVLSIVILAVAIGYELLGSSEGSPLLGKVAGVAMVVSPLFIGIILSPQGKPVDYSVVAVQAIYEIDELRRSNRAVVDELSKLGELQDPTHLRVALANNAAEMIRQHEQLGRAVGHWNEVSPRAVEDFVNREVRNRNMLLEMERVREGEELHNG